MRFYNVYFLCGLALAWTGLATTATEFPRNVAPPPHDGQPGCGIRYEFTRLWRNNNEDGQYWQCTAWQLPARVRHCPSGTLFQDSWQVCVPFDQWRWTPYIEPPTRPYERVAQCEEVVIETNPECIDCECPVCPDEQITTPITPTTPTGQTTPSTIPTTPDGGGTTTPGNGGEDLDPMGVCPGASDSQHNPGTMSCFRPECTMTQWLDGVLYPTRDPTHFFQCGPGTGNLFIMPCAPGTCFSFRRQVCIHIRDWQNDCA